MEWLQANWLPLLILVLVVIGFIIYLIFEEFLFYKRYALERDFHH